MVKYIVNGVVVVAGLVGLRQFYRNWGTTKGECSSRLPGDDLVGAPAVQTTEGVWVDAPADAVWSELLRTLRNRAGVSRWLAAPLQVAQLSEGAVLVLQSTPKGLHAGAVWSVSVIPHGADRCRVLLRNRIGLRHPGQFVGVELLGPVRALVTRAMLRGVQRRAESAPFRVAAEAVGVRGFADADADPVAR
ncbi:SRPBCC family protein [Mycolicibacterium frederiksbergense]|uniref:SRPBCC family protein n=1 Tax=Mycolicibacterium frederiksbergense TaxID=117567 RepID=UPI001AE5AE72|nr:SRPBCC family protein [Mycolicibacterium frederiksbergense]